MAEQIASLAAGLPASPPGWTRHVDPSANEVEYRYTEGMAARAKLTVRETPAGTYLLASKRGCDTLSETTVESVEAAVETARAALDLPEESG